MQTQGKFALLQLDEFEGWLRQQNITRRVYAVQQHHTWSPNYSNFMENNHFHLLQHPINGSMLAKEFMTRPLTIEVRSKRWLLSVPVSLWL